MTASTVPNTVELEGWLNAALRQRAVELGHDGNLAKANKAELVDLVHKLELESAEGFAGDDEDLDELELTDEDLDELAQSPAFPHNMPRPRSPQRW